MGRFILTVAFLLSTAGSAQAAITYRVGFDVRHVEVVHQPTGCNAKIVLVNDAYAGAYIVDPACLPQGGKPKKIPAELSDFNVNRDELGL